MDKSFTPICILLTLFSLCAVQAQAQSAPARVQEGKKDTVWTISPELFQKVQEAFMSPSASPIRGGGTSEIQELTDEIMNKPEHKPTNGRPGLRPYSMRVDSYDELERLTAEGVKGRIVPERLMKLLKPKPLLYTDHNVWFRW